MITGEDEHDCQTECGIGQEVHEVSSIVVSNTCPDPRAMILINNKVRSIWRTH